MDLAFPLFTHNFLKSSADIVPLSNVIVEYEYSKSFLISGGNFVVRYMLKTNLINESFVTQYYL